MKAYIRHVTKEKGFEMNKLPTKFRQPIVGLCIMLTMLTAMPAIILLQRLPPQADFNSIWLQTIGQVAPFAIPLGITSAVVFNLLANIVFEKAK